MTFRYIPSDKISNGWKPKILSVGGGGLKGISAVGCISILQKDGLLDDVRVLCGTSIGALITALILIGYSPMDLTTIIFDKALNEVNFQQLNVFGQWKKHTNNNEKKKDSIEEDYGIVDSTIVKEFIEGLLEKKKIDINITLKQLFEMTRIPWMTNVVRITDDPRRQLAILDYHSGPDITLVEAILMATAFPIIFSSRVWNDILVLDGGLIDNVVRKIFPLEDILAIHLSKRGSRFVSKDDDESKKNSLFQPFQLMSQKLFKIVQLQMDYSEALFMQGMEYHEIEIDTGSTETFSTHISTEEKLNLLIKGVVSTIKYLRNPTIISWNKFEDIDYKYIPSENTRSLSSIFSNAK